MYDDFFFPYEKAKLWTGNMFLLSLSNFLLYASLYMMLPVLPLWMVRHWYCSYAEAGAAIAVFGLAMFLPGTFNSYLIDTFKRKSVCFSSDISVCGIQSAISVRCDRRVRSFGQGCPGRAVQRHYHDYGQYTGD